MVNWVRGIRAGRCCDFYTAFKLLKKFRESSQDLRTESPICPSVPPLVNLLPCGLGIGCYRLRPLKFISGTRCPSLFMVCLGSKDPQNGLLCIFHILILSLKTKLFDFSPRGLRGLFVQSEQSCRATTQLSIALSYNFITQHTSKCTLNKSNYPTSNPFGRKIS